MSFEAEYISDEDYSIETSETYKGDTIDSDSFIDDDDDDLPGSSEDFSLDSDEESTEEELEYNSSFEVISSEDDSSDDDQSEETANNNPITAIYTPIRSRSITQQFTYSRGNSNGRHLGNILYLTRWTGEWQGRTHVFLKIGKTTLKQSDNCLGCREQVKKRTRRELTYFPRYSARILTFLYLLNAHEIEKVLHRKCNKYRCSELTDNCGATRTEFYFFDTIRQQRYLIMTILDYLTNTQLEGVNESLLRSCINYLRFLLENIPENSSSMPKRKQ